MGCLPPDKLKPIKLQELLNNDRCKTCQFYIETITSIQAEAFINGVIKNEIEITGLSKQYYFHYLIDNLDITKINQNQNPIFILIDFLNCYITPTIDKEIIVQDDLVGLKITVDHYLSLSEDILSQMIFYSNTWRQLVSIGLNRITGYSNGYIWTKYPFSNKDMNTWTIMQKRLITITQILYSYWDRYKAVDYCTSCYNKDNRETPLANRQEVCYICDSKVNRYHNSENRFIRYQYNDMFGKSNTVHILDKEEYSVFSLLQWFYEKIENIINIKNKQHKK